MTKLFESQWSATKKLLCEGKDLTHNQDGSLNPNKKKMMETVLENTHRELKLLESATSGATNAANVATLNKVILPVIRRVMLIVFRSENTMAPHGNHGINIRVHKFFSPLPKHPRYNYYHR